MTNKDKFIEELTSTVDLTLILSEASLEFWNNFVKGKISNSEITDLGRSILNWLNENRLEFFSAKQIGEGLFVSSRVISGAARKLVTDGYLEKEGKNPVTYRITSEGHNILLGDEIS